MSLIPGPYPFNVRIEEDNHYFHFNTGWVWVIGYTFWNYAVNFGFNTIVIGSQAIPSVLFCFVLCCFFMFVSKVFCYCVCDFVVCTKPCKKPFFYMFFFKKGTKKIEKKLKN